MSNLENDRLAERLFADLEELEEFMSLPEYADQQQQLLRFIAEGNFEEAMEQVNELQRKYQFELTNQRIENGKYYVEDIF